MILSKRLRLGCLVGLGTGGKNQLHNTLKAMWSQEENFLRYSSHFADLRLKCCIGEKKFENNISGSNPSLPPLVILIIFGNLPIPRERPTSSVVVLILSRTWFFPRLSSIGFAGSAQNSKPQRPPETTGIRVDHLKGNSADWGGRSNAYRQWRF